MIFCYLRLPFVRQAWMENLLKYFWCRSHKVSITLTIWLVGLIWFSLFLFLAALATPLLMYVFLSLALFLNSLCQSVVDISMQGSKRGIDICHGNYTQVVWFRHCHFHEGTLISVSLYLAWSDSSVPNSYKVLMNQLIKKKNRITVWGKTTCIVIRTVKEMT